MKYPLLLLLSCLLSGIVFSQGVPSINYDSTIIRISATTPDYNTVSIRAKMVWGNDKSEQDFQANIRMVKDSLVWMSLTGAMGIEGARILITPDSFKIINKLTNEYLARDFSYIESWLLFPVNFHTFQQMIIGGRINIGNNAATAVVPEDSALMVYNETDKLLEKIKVDSLSYTIRKILLKDKLLKQDMAITFDGYKTEEGKTFSYRRNIDVNRDGSMMNLTMDITRLRWNEELTFPFEISDKYKRAE